MKTKFFVAFTFILTAAVSIANPAENIKTTRPSKDIDWSRTTPVEFLKILKTNSDSVMLIEDDHRPPKDWIKEKDIDELLELIGSDEPAAPVVTKNSPLASPPVSTVSTEVMYLMEGLKSDKYPPTVCSVYDFNPDPEAYKKWWKEWKKGYRIRHKVGSLKVIQHVTSREEIMKDNKPAILSESDKLLFREDFIVFGPTKTLILVNKKTNLVEYIWSPPYKCYVRADRFSPGIQKIYTQKAAAR